MTGNIKAGIDIGGTGTRIILRDDKGTLDTRTIATAEFAAIDIHDRAGALASTYYLWFPRAGNWKVWGSVQAVR